MLHTNSLIKQSLVLNWLFYGNECFLLFLFLDCMDIALQSMLQSILQRNSLRSTRSSGGAQIEELTEDGQCVNLVIKLLTCIWHHICKK